MNLVRCFASLALAHILGACTAVETGPSGPAGHLLIIGGGLDDDARPVYERLLALASLRGGARILIATAATEPGFDEHSELVDKTEALRAWAPDVPVQAVLRETSTADTVAAIDRATAILFTGGDQSRITRRYRPAGKDTPEWLAMRRLLARGGVIAGCSAGAAMMGELMLLRDGAKSGALIAPGMNFLPWGITDSHFFERDRVGRLAAALEASGRRLGIGIGEDAAVEVDLMRGTLTGLTVADSLLVDVASMQREGRALCRARARLIRQGERVSLSERMAATMPAPPPKPAGPARVMPRAEPGQNRQLASWRVFAAARRPESSLCEIELKGWRLIAWPDGRGEIVFDIIPATLEPAPVRAALQPGPARTSDHVSARDNL